MKTTILRFISLTFSKLKFITKEDKYNLQKIGSGYGGNTVNTSIFRRNSLATHNDIQVISYYDKKGYIIIGKRKINETKWQIKKLSLTGNIRDAHNIISIELDGEGYIHMAYGMHNKKLNYLVSEKPYSLRMMPVKELDGVEEDSITYPEFYRLENGDLLLAYWNGKSGNGNLILKRYYVKQKKWKTIQSNLIDGEGERNAYCQMSVGNNGKIYLSWVWRENPDVSSNHDICYAFSNDYGETWQKSSGDVYELPITLKSAEIIVNIPEGSNLMNQGGICENPNGYPLIATYWQAKGEDGPQYHTLCFNGEYWKVDTVGRRNIPFQLRGRGTKNVPISRPCVFCSEKKVYILVRDKERGSKITLGEKDENMRNEWSFRDLTSFNVEAWEPTIDWDLWKEKNLLNIFVESTMQKDGNDKSKASSRSKPVYVLSLQL